MGLLVAGNNPAAVKTAERNIFTATASQTTFTITQGYQPGDIDVYLNGVRLVDTDDYVAVNGTTVVLNSGAVVGDSVVVVCFRPFQVADFYTKSEQDTRYVNATGDTINGIVTINSGDGNIGLIAQGNNTSAQLKLERLGGSAGAGHIGADNSYCFRAYNSSLSIDGLRVDQSGRISMPQQPAFCATSSGAYQTTSSMPFTSTKVNVNNCFSTSTYRFTAPVAGRYFFTCHVYFDNNTTADGYPRFKLNGATNHGYAYMQGNSDGDKTLAMSTILDLSANDYVQLIYTGTLNYYGGAEETQFMGFLIG